MFHPEMQKLKATLFKHKFVILSLLVCLVAVLWWAAGKTTYIYVEDSKSKYKTFKPGVKLLSQLVVPDPTYEFANPQVINLVCADGVKILVSQMSMTPIGECE